MIIYPAIDLRQGRCVRLRQGDPKAETVFSEDPVAVARHWVEQGAEWLHVVNLDGALGATQTQLSTLRRPANILVKRLGADKPETPEADLLRQLPVNLQQLRAIRHAVAVPIQFGGGLRTMDDIRLVLELGANRVVLGTVAIEDPDLVEMALQQWGADRIVVSIDACDGKVATRGWQSVSEVDAVDLGYRMHALGVKRIIYTDIGRDGMLSGVNVEASARLGDITDLNVIASGGVADIHDIERLKAHEHYNIDGVVIGQALYTNQINLRDAVELGHQPLRRRSAGIIPYRHSFPEKSCTTPQEAVAQRREPSGCRQNFSGDLYEQGRVEFLLLFNLFFEQWQFPRGGVQIPEDDASCARREFAEETSLPILKFYEDCRTVLAYTASIRNHEIERTIVYYLAEVGNEEVRLGHEDHCEARWLSPQETWELLTETSPEQLPALDAAMAYLETLNKFT